MKKGNESWDVLGDSRKPYRGPWAEIGKYWPGKEPIRLQDSLPCPLKKKKKKNKKIMRFIISIQQFGNTSVGIFWMRWTRVNQISIYSKCFIYMIRWRISEKSVISCNRVKTFFLSAKTAENRKLATKQQKRCFEWDKAKMTQLAANRPKSQFQTKKAKNNIKKTNKRKSVVTLL